MKLAGWDRWLLWSGAVLMLVLALLWALMSAWQASVLEEMEYSLSATASSPEITAVDSQGFGDFQVRQTELLERPLFMSTRRPPESLPPPEQMSPADQPRPELPDLRLTSVIILPESRYAWLQPLDGSALLRLREGDVYQEWTLITVGADYVVFRLGDVVHELLLRREIDVGINISSMRVIPQGRIP